MMLLSFLAALAALFVRSEATCSGTPAVVEIEVMSEMAGERNGTYYYNVWAMNYKSINTCSLLLGDGDSVFPDKWTIECTDSDIVGMLVYKDTVGTDIPEGRNTWQYFWSPYIVDYDIDVIVGCSGGIEIGTHCAEGDGKRGKCDGMDGCNYVNGDCVESDVDYATAECIEILDKQSCKARNMCDWRRDACTGPMSQPQCEYDDFVFQLTNHQLKINRATAVYEDTLIGQDVADVTCMCFDLCRKMDEMVFWNLEVDGHWEGKCTCYGSTYGSLKVKSTSKNVICGGIDLASHEVIERAAN